MRLNVDVIRRRGLELGFSVRDLAARLGVSPQVVRALEAGTNHHTLNLGFVTKLAALLAAEPQLLLAPPALRTDVDADDDLVSQLGSLLVSMTTLTPTTVLAKAIGVTVEKVDEALKVLSARLGQVGLTLHRLDDDVEIRPSLQVDVGPVRVMLRGHLARRGMTLTEARLLYRIRNGGVDEGKLSNPDRVALQRLRVAGIVEDLSGTRPPSLAGAHPRPDE